MRAAAVSGMPGPLSPISTSDLVALAGGAHGQPAGAVHAVHGVDGVVDQVGPDLVELAGVGGQLGQRPVVVAHHLDARRQLVLQHGQGGLEPVVDVELLERAAVHLAVLLGRADEGRDPPGGLGDLLQQALGLAGDGDEPDGVGQRPGRDGGGDPLQPAGVDPGGDQRRCQVPGAVDAVVRPASRPARPRGRRPPAGTAAPGRRGRCTAWRTRSTSSASCPPSRRPRPARPARPRGRRSALGQGGGGPGGGGRRVVELVGEAGGDGAEGDQALAGADRLLGAHPLDGEPLQHVGGHREPLPHRPAEVVGGQHPEAAVGDGAQAGAVRARDRQVQSTRRTPPRRCRGGRSG